MHRLHTLSAPQIFVLAVVGGGSITDGALFSVVLGAGVDSLGPQHLLVVPPIWSGLSAHKRAELVARVGGAGDGSGLAEGDE